MNKKKFSLLSLMAGMALFFSACSHESYTHQMDLAYPLNQQGYIYADQTLDSICFFTFDSYHYYAYAQNPGNFISIDTKYERKKIVNDPYARWLISLPVYFTPNTTDSCRLGYVMVDSSSEIDDWTGTVHGNYYQFNWHCISNPAPKYQYKKNGLVEACDHILCDSTQKSETLAFYAWDDWSLSSDNPDRVKPTQEKGNRSERISTGLSLIKVPLTLVPNETSDTLWTNLQLLSNNGAKTIIKVKQVPVKTVVK